MAKVWRNSEGREFPACSNNVEICGVIEGCYISPAGMSNLGYELVEGEAINECFQRFVGDAAVVILTCMGCQGKDIPDDD